MNDEIVPIRVISKALTAKLAAICLPVFLAFFQVNRGAILFEAPKYPAGCRPNVPCVHLIACAVAVVIILFVAAHHCRLQVGI